MRRVSRLDRGWTLRLDGTLPNHDGNPAAVAATVPGCVHLDLLAAGLIEDPYVDRNELDLIWIGERDWVYNLAFTAERAGPAERVDIVFDGIDGVATITLNGAVLGHTVNQHRTYRFDVADIVRSANELTVAFASPVEYAESQRRAHGALPNPFGQPYNFIRKMASNFGWDWGPRLTTSGLWRGVRLERWRGARLRRVRPTAHVPTPEPCAGEAGWVDVVVEIEHGRDGDAAAVISARLRSPAGDVIGESLVDLADGDDSATLAVAAPDVERWWPVGRGDQPRYDLEVTVQVDGIATDEVVHRLGFRHVELDTSPQEDGSTFAFVVNGERVWVRGVNWIPADCFPSRVTSDVLASRLDAALGMNANLVRVWGGGVYESDAFYELCDRAGILVWQDFMFACAAYPEAALYDEVAAEAADNVTRLMPHPSLVLWCGNNECLEGWSDWGWRDIVGERPWGEGLYRSLLPAIVMSLDPARPYIDGTPTSIDPAVPPQDPAHGTIHVWDVWNEYDYAHYRTHRPRFVAEFGFQAPAVSATLMDAITERPIAIGGAAIAHRQRALDGERKLTHALGRRFGAITDVDDWLYCTQVNQAKAIEVGIGHFRGLHDRCSGVIWWQLNDCWPAISWSVIDWAGRRKPAWFAMRRAFADQIAVFDPTGAEPALVLVNDARSQWEPSVSILRVAPSGVVLASHDHKTTVPAGGTRRITVPSSLASDRSSDLLVATAGTVRTTYHRLVERFQNIARPQWDAAVSFAPSSVTVDVTARTLVRDLCLFADRVDPHAEVDDQLMTLLPGESHRFTVQTQSPLGEAAWVAALTPPDGPSQVLRAVGDRRRGGSMHADDGQEPGIDR